MAEKNRMRNGFVSDLALKRFLLGDVDEAERQRIETLFISDAEASQRILAAEDELFEDYLEDSLDASDRARFLQQYANTPEQRRRLRIVRSIKDYAVAEAVLDTAAVPASKWRSFFSSLMRHRMSLIPVAATLIIALVASAFWVMQWNAGRDRENNRHLAIERELSDLNTPARLGEVPPQLLSMVLSPVSVRSMQGGAELNPQPGQGVVELRLLWTQKEQYGSYRAIIHQVDKSDRYGVSNLHLEHGTGSFVRVRLPATILVRGLYQVTLSGLSSDGAPDLSEEYTFSVSR